MKIIPILLLALSSALCLRAQSSSRLIAFAKWSSDTTIAPYDTGGYAYSNGRGGQVTTIGYDHPSLSFKCDFPFALRPNSDFLTGHSGITKYDSAWEYRNGYLGRSLQTFDVLNNITYSTYQVPDTSGAWLNDHTTSYGYDFYYNLVSKDDWRYSLGGLNTHYQYLYGYDSYNRLISEIDISPDTSIKSRQLYTYDSPGNLVEDRGQQWDSTTNAWDSQVYTHFYYTGTKVDTFKMTTGAMGGYYFSPANDTMILNRGNQLITRTYDMYHNETSETFDVIDPATVAIPSYKVYWTYNSFNQITAERTYIKDPSGNWQFNRLYRYYYELYTSEVDETEKARDIQLYPNPATKQVTITSSAMITSVAINNLVGQTVFTHNYNSEKIQVDISNLPSGVYLVRVNGTEVRKFVKQ